MLDSTAFAGWGCGGGVEKQREISRTYFIEIFERKNALPKTSRGAEGTATSVISASVFEMCVKWRFGDTMNQNRCESATIRCNLRRSSHGD